MPHIIFPDGANDVKQLLIAINNKHTEDGTKSVLNVYLNANTINLDNEILIADQANTLDKTKLILARKASNNIELRDLEMKKVTSNIKSEVQYLKSIYKTNPKELGNWGIVVEGTNKIVYPSSFDGLTTTFNTFLAKHNSYAISTSPLNDFLVKNNINVSKDAFAVSDAIAYNEKASLSNRESEDARQHRDLLLHSCIARMKGIGQYLVNLYINNEKGLVDYGFTVYNSVSKPQIVHTSIKLQSKKTLKGVLIGSNITNEGTEDIHIYKGKAISGNPIVIHAKEQFGVVKGYSTITISNPSLLNTAIVSVLRSGQRR